MKPIIAFFIFVCAAHLSYAQIGIGTTSPNSTLDVRGSLSTKYTSFSANTTASSADHTLVFTGTSAATLTLPDATACQGRAYWVKNTSSNASTLTIGTTSSQTVDGIASWSLTQTNKVICVFSNGANWIVASESLPGNSAGTAWINGGNNVASQQNIGTTSNFHLPFITNNTEKMRLTSAGSLGIGVTSPAEKLEVAGNVRISGGNRRIVFGTPGGDPDAFIEHRAYGASDFNEILFYIGDDASASYGPDRIRMIGEEYKFQAFDNPSNSTLANAESETNTKTRFWITSEGNVSIGSDTLDPDSPEKFRVDAGVTTSYNLINGVGSRNGYLQSNIQNLSNGNSASSDVVATANNGSESTVYIDMGINSQGYSTGASNILNGSNTAYLYATGSHFYIGNGAQNKDLIFFTNTGSTGADGTERIRILAAGAVCIGTSTQNAANKLTVNGSISASAFNVSSDRRLKTDIRAAHYGLTTIMNLQPVSWKWNDNAMGTSRQLGLIAQDVRKEIPEIVSGNEQTGTLSINYTELVPVLINAIKEQQKQIDELNKKIKRLERN